MRKVFGYTAAATVLALGMVVSSALISKFFVRVKHEDDIRVKGYAEKTVQSDIGKFSVTLREKDPSRKQAYERLRKLVTEVREKMKAGAPDDLELSESAPNVDENFARNPEGELTNQIDQYTVSQTIDVTSGDVEWIASTNRSLWELLASGNDATIRAPEYLVSDLKDVKLALLELATSDAFQRAELLARNSGAKVGKLSSANQGVFQITEPNSTSTSGYGVYDTTTIEKTVKAVVTLKYSVE